MGAACVVVLHAGDVSDCSFCDDSDSCCSGFLYDSDEEFEYEKLSGKCFDPSHQVCAEFANAGSGGGHNVGNWIILCPKQMPQVCWQHVWGYGMGAHQCFDPETHACVNTSPMERSGNYTVVPLELQV